MHLNHEFYVVIGKQCRTKKCVHGSQIQYFYMNILLLFICPRIFALGDYSGTGIRQTPAIKQKMHREEGQPHSFPALQPPLPITCKFLTLNVLGCAKSNK